MHEGMVHLGVAKPNLIQYCDGGNLWRRLGVKIRSLLRCRGRIGVGPLGRVYTRSMGVVDFIAASIISLSRVRWRVGVHAGVIISFASQSVRKD